MTCPYSSLSTISSCLHLRYLHTHGRIVYLRKALFTPVTMKYAAEPNQMVYYTSSEGQIRSSSSYLYPKVLLCVCQCTQCNIVCHWKTHCILVKWVLYRTVFIDLQFYCDHSCFCKANYLFSFLFDKYSFITKILHIESSW
jgi:hypothetical protein